MIVERRLARAGLEKLATGTRQSTRDVDASLRNAEVVAAMGMLPALTRRWVTQNAPSSSTSSKAAGSRRA